MNKNKNQESKTSLKKTLAGDFSGGLTGSILALPESLAYGTLVVAPLGAQFIPIGVIIGILSFTMMNIGTAIFNKKSIIISGPFSLTALMLASTIEIIYVKYSGYDVYSVVLPLFFMVVFFAGLFQLLFGLLKLGGLTKYIPHPVISGLLNGTAILIFLGQINTLLGLKNSIKLTEIITNSNDIIWTSSAIGLITAVSVLFGDKIIKRIPAPFIGIFIGSAAYYLFKYLNYSLGNLIGTISIDNLSVFYLLKINYLEFFAVSENINFLLFELIPVSVSIALIISLRSLISLVSVDKFTNSRSDANAYLAGHGMGNMFSAFFGGIACTGSVAVTTASHKYGAKTGNSKLFSGIITISILLLLHSVIAYLPKVVLAGILLTLALTVFDSWIFKLIKQLFSDNSRREKREFLVNIILVLIVTFSMVLIGIFEAIFVGIGVSILTFVIRMGKDVIRNVFSGDKIRSNVERPQFELALLEKEGHIIKIIELDGSLFFGTADKIAEVVTPFIEGSEKYIILDFKRIKDIDSTGINILGQLIAKCTAQNKFLMFSNISDDNVNFELFTKHDNIYSNLEDALAWCEDDLIINHVKGGKQPDIDLESIDALNHLTEYEIEILKSIMTKETYASGDTIFQAGDAGDSVYFIIKGRAKVLINLGKDNWKRVSTLCAGTMFGEMALIDGKPRSANVVADGELTCYFLEKDKLAELSNTKPKIAYGMAVGVSKELSKRIRIINSVLSQLRS